MSSNDLTMTLVGWIATVPRHYPGVEGGVPFTSFRMANTRRYRDRTTGQWVDGRTDWFTIKAFRHVARNLAESMRQGDPVIVHGRLTTEEYTPKEGGTRTNLVIDAVAIGPDLAFGTSRFARTVHTTGRAEGAEESTGPATDTAPDAWDHPADAPDDRVDGDRELDDEEDAEPDGEPTTQDAAAARAAGLALAGRG